AKLVAHVNSQALHARCLTAFTHVDVNAPADYRRHGKFGSRRTQHATAVEFFDADRVFENHDHRSRDTNGAERLISLVYQQYSSIECHYPAPPFVYLWGEELLIWSSRAVVRMRD